MDQEEARMQLSCLYVPYWIGVRLCVCAFLCIYTARTTGDASSFPYVPRLAWGTVLIPSVAILGFVTPPYSLSIASVINRHTCAYRSLSSLPLISKSSSGTSSLYCPIVFDITSKTFLISSP